MTPADLRRRREAIGLTQAEMARLLGYTGDHIYSTVGRWECGRRAIPPDIAALLYLVETVPGALEALKMRAGIAAAPRPGV